ncbi:hypothetical protein B0H11DRAFT_1908191 [Mycena galericulata]|nr:hypothetical protein B0H11DRAFT_1915803 [Mycena galericulata]KAJ7482065.1 hypothetical protein B0H11DRAFT_1915349 [Mycena galericulata]KAJ7501316.1 hypothetical protein B0H11DRAFT_1908191 [Mycena galericulata]
MMGLNFQFRDDVADWYNILPRFESNESGIPSSSSVAVAYTVSHYSSSNKNSVYFNIRVVMISTPGEEAEEEEEAGRKDEDGGEKGKVEEDATDEDEAQLATMASSASMGSSQISSDYTTRGLQVGTSQFLLVRYLVAAVRAERSVSSALITGYNLSGQKGPPPIPRSLFKYFQIILPTGSKLGHPDFLFVLLFGRSYQGRKHDDALKKADMLEEVYWAQNPE